MFSKCYAIAIIGAGIEEHKIRSVPEFVFYEVELTNPVLTRKYGGIASDI
ncbi:MAG: hypothetical protein NT163_08525 [Chlorobiales bacterium]|nr:hypothetical protein [Chlorobiales bacterium]